MIACYYCILRSPVFASTQRMIGDKFGLHIGGQVVKGRRLRTDAGMGPPHGINQKQHFLIASHTAPFETMLLVTSLRVSSATTRPSGEPENSPAAGLEVLFTGRGVGDLTQVCGVTQEGLRAGSVRI